MQNRLQQGARLGRQALLFPLCLVLYEFSTYIGNDMIQPGMLAVVEQYQAGIDCADLHDCLSGRGHVSAMAARAVVGSSGPSSGDVSGRGVVYCDLHGDAAGAKH